MPSYLLLRNNKQTGPLSLNELLTLGLKPYDLVWVDGRSAAWRYPSEIAELKEYAPIVEEQPYDRFFKKSSTEAVKEEVLQEKTNIKFQPEKLVSEKKEDPYKNYQPQNDKPIFISMPVAKKNSVQYNSQPVEKKQQPVDYKSSYDLPQEPALEKKYSQSLDEIKEMYINTLQERKTRIRRKEIVKKYLKPALLPLLLLITGVVIGYFLTSKKNSLQASQAISTIIPQPKIENTPGKNKVLQPDRSITSGTENNQVPGQKELKETRNQNKNTKAVLQPYDPGKNKKEVIIPADETARVQKQDVEIDPSTGERKKAVRNEGLISQGNEKSNSEKQSFVETEQKDIRKLVSVKTNNYVRGAFGGIKDLRLSVSNSSKYLVDAVTVELEYIKPSQQPLRTDIITFKNISANGTITIKVPDSQRGIRVNYRITNIESKQFEKGTAGL